jgi:hypothetical protein
MNTKQFEFDAVVAHLYAQGRPAKAGMNQCLYRAEYDGKTLSCAVGCRIPDATYEPAMDALDDTSVDILVEEFGNVLPKEIEEYLPMFERLQSAHDDSSHTVAGGFNLKVLGKRLECIATEFGLNFTNPE